MAIISRDKIMRRLAKWFDRQLYSRTVNWPRHAGYSAIQRNVDAIGIAGIPNDRCFTLYSVAGAIAGVPGHMAECGSRRGKSAHFLLGATAGATDKKLFIFDSFEGLSEPTAEDHLHTGASAWQKGALATDEAILKNNLAAYSDRISVHKGWIPERFADVEGERFSLVHVDVDLYEPSMQSLDFFYERVAPGGIFVCDDYGSRSCPGARRAFDEFFADRAEVIIELPTAQALVIKV